LVASEWGDSENNRRAKFKQLIEPEINQADVEEEAERELKESWF
jgi:hypothetical protein